MFDRLVWKQDRMLLDNLVFRLKHFANDKWELGENCFEFIKVKELVDDYQIFFSVHKDFKAETIVELGLFDGGSAAFWFEYFQPTKLVGVDLMQREDSNYFKKYVQDKNIENRIKTFWGVNQADIAALKQIVSAETNQKLDLVIDDASHLYEPTKASFEYLFPLLRPGGLYIIEDWAWEHWKDFHSPLKQWIKEKKSLSDFISELIGVAGTTGSKLISSVTVYPGFTVVMRGSMDLQNDFKIAEYLLTRPAQTFSLKTLLKKKSRRLVKALLRRFK